MRFAVPLLAAGAPALLAGALACAVLACALLGAGCEDREVYPFGGHLFDQDAGCLQGATVFEVIEGTDPGPCAGARCWITPEGLTIVTTSACEAPEGYTEVFAESVDAGNATCGPALEALDGGACP